MQTNSRIELLKKHQTNKLFSSKLAVSLANLMPEIFFVPCLPPYALSTAGCFETATMLAEQLSALISKGQFFDDDGRMQSNAKPNGFNQAIQFEQILKKTNAAKAAMSHLLTHPHI